MMIHEHTFEPRDGSTLARDTVRYAAPFERLVHRWLVRPDIERMPASLLAAVAGMCFHLTMNNAIAAERTLLDFSTVTNATAWQIVNDDVMGGVSSGRFSVTNGVAVFRGELSLENQRWHWPILQTFCSSCAGRQPLTDSST